MESTIPLFYELRREAGLTLSEVQELFGVELDRLLSYDRGETRPTPAELQVLRGMGAVRRSTDGKGGLPKPETPENANDFRKTLVSVQRRAVTRSNSNLPHPIPYQGSKRSLAPLIGAHIPLPIQTWYEPFAGSAAMTLWAAERSLANGYVIADSLEAMSSLWSEIIERPEETADKYEQIWRGQQQGDNDYFNRVRSRYNARHHPIDLLYLICRCVKNSVRFNREGAFTQSVDRRRLGMRPEKMRDAVVRASRLLKGRTEVRHGDWLSTTHDAAERDFLYMDPPYLGTSIGRDKRYAHQMDRDRLVEGLHSLIKRRIRFALSYDGMTGTKEYGPPLPESLCMTRLLLHAGKSSQATLMGRNETTIESLYLSPGLLPCQQPQRSALDLFAVAAS